MRRACRGGMVKETRRVRNDTEPTLYPHCIRRLGAAPGQKAGSGWRLALFHALSETPDSRSAETVTQEKKALGLAPVSRRKQRQQPAA